jgi:hypothetical protein
MYVKYRSGASASPRLRTKYYYGYCKQPRSNKREISGVDRKEVRNRSLARNSMLNEHLESMRVERAGTGAFPFQAVDLKIYRKKSDYNLAGELSISCDRTLLSERVGDAFYMRVCIHMN